MTSESPRDILERLYEVVCARRDERPEGSYVVQLLDGGWDSLGAKIGEEADEVAEAGASESDAAFIHEAADLLFHLWVGLVARGVAPSAVYEELAGRFGIGGLVEKAGRARRGREEEDG